MKSLTRTAEGKPRRNAWRTPPWFFAELELRQGYRFELDVFASASNALCPYYIDRRLDALRTPWDAETVFANPPDALHLEAVRRAISEGWSGSYWRARLLVRCGIESQAWQLASAHALESVIVCPRLNYADPSGGRSNGAGRHSTLFTFSKESARRPVDGHGRQIRFEQFRRPQ